MEKAESFIVLANILRTAPYTVMGAGRWDGRIAFSMLTRDPPLPTHPDCAQAYVARSMRYRTSSSEPILGHQVK